jgi:hypothetical protein
MTPLYYLHCPSLVVACPANSYCPAAATNNNIDPSQLIKPCPSNTVAAAGSSKLGDCVNAPGYSYKSTQQGGKAAVVAVPCPADSYCVGLAKQAQCTPCSKNFKTGGLQVESLQANLLLDEQCPTSSGNVLAQQSL